MKWATARYPNALDVLERRFCRPLRGLAPFFCWDPGAYAPGFMLDAGFAG